MAREQNKLVLVNFTGYACTNCHWMKANMFTRPEIQAAFKDFVIVDLYTDGTDADSEKNQKLEDQRFGTASIPFYAILDANQNVCGHLPPTHAQPARVSGLPANQAENVTLKADSLVRHQRMWRNWQTHWI